VPPTAQQPSGYVELLAGNQDYRRLLIGQVISQTGDWFNSVALFTLLLTLTGSGEAVTLVLILKLLPTFFVGPLAGVVADRYDRKRIMIAADILRGIVVLGFLLVQTPNLVWLVYLLTTTEVVLSAFFEPAKSASIPNIVPGSALVSANALSSATWSVTLAVGAALGGVVTGAFGRNTAFVVDSISFFVSAVFISRVRFPVGRPSPRGKPSGAESRDLFKMLGVTDIVEGARYLRSNPPVIGLLLVKTGWGLAGGILLLLTVYGKQVFPIGREGSTSIGLLYAARGAGAVIGPMIAQAVVGMSSRAMRHAIGISFFISAVFYLLIAHAQSLWVALLLVVGAHAGGSIQWTFSTALLQITVPDMYRGRVFALDMALLTLSMSLSTYMTGWGLDRAGMNVRAMTTVLGAVFIAPGIAWFIHLRWLKPRHEEGTELTLPVSEAGKSPESSFPPA
jgi:predicted MFS family arabinose efflux permease